MAVRSHRDLIACQKAMDFVEAIYRATATFPREETYGLTSQLRRSVNSVPSNIAERQGRETTQEFLRFLAMSYGSLLEAETQVLLAQRLGSLSAGDAASHLDHSAELGRLLHGLRRSLSRPSGTDH